MLPVRPLLVALAVALVVAACADDRQATTPAPSSSSAPRSPDPATAAPTAPSSSATPARSPAPVVIAAPPDSVYRPPDPLPDGRPGDPMWVERVRAPRGSVAWRVLYRSESIDGRAIAVSGLVVAPDRRAPEGGFPVIGYAHGTTGLADRCAPSKEANRIADGSPRIGSVPLPPLWEQGYVVAATDYEGLGTPGRHPYLVGGSEGRGVLDAIRAAQRLPDAHAGGPAIVLGVSQGGHAALFAGELAAGYAPEVDLRGVVALAPAAELSRAAMLLAGEDAAVGFAVAIGAGFAAAYPEADLRRVLTRSARRALDVVDDGCIDDVLAAFARPARDVIDLKAILAPPWPALLEANTPGRVPTSAPIFVGQGTADRLVIPELTDLLIDRLCSAGNRVTYRRYPGAEHGGVAVAAAADVDAWARDRLAGGSPPSDCGG